MTMDCDEVKQYLPPHGDVRPTPEQQLAITRHLAQCFDCRDLMDAHYAREAERALDEDLGKLAEHRRREERLWSEAAEAVGAAGETGPEPQSTELHPAREWAAAAIAWFNAVIAAFWRSKGLRPAAAAALLLLLLYSHMMWTVSRQFSGLTDAIAHSRTDSSELVRQLSDAREDAARARALWAETQQLQRQTRQLHSHIIKSMFGPGQERAAEGLAAVYTLGHDEGIDLAAAFDGSRFLFQGLSDVSRGDYAAAIRSFTRAQQTFQSRGLRVMVLFGLGFAQKCENRYEESLTTYDTILSLVPASSEAATLRAMAFHFRGWSMYELAEAEMDQGRLVRARDRLARAMGDYRRALDLIPGYVKVRYNEGLALMKAAELAEKEKSSDPDRARSLREQATRKFKAAEDGFERRLAANPDDAKSHFSLAMVKSILGEHKGALQHLTRAVDIDGHISVLLDQEHVFDRYKDKREYKAIQEKAKALRGTVPANPLDIFFDADLPTPAPSQRAI